MNMTGGLIDFLKQSRELLRNRVICTDGDINL